MRKQNMNTGMERFMLLRNYVKTDCAQLARLFYDTVHTVNAKAAPHNYVCGSQRIFCTSSAVSKTGNTYSIPSFLKLCTGTKSLAELPCQIMRCCPKYKCVGGLSVFGSPPLKLRGGLFGEFAYCRNTMKMQNIMRHLNAAWMLWPD